MTIKKISGFLNRYLHWHDIQYFKSKNFKIYDFGGLSLSQSNRKLQQIDKFKLSFGGTIIQEYNYMLTSNPIYKKIIPILMLNRGF